MIEVLNSYLLQHKSISIPGLGTIYVERVPAQSDFVNKQLLPPSYRYRFNKYFDAPDKEFFAFLASKKGIADFEAIRIYNEWAFDFRQRIDAEHSAGWEGVGSLTKDVSGEIVFEPVSALPSFNLPVPAERVIRSNSEHLMLVGDKELTNVEMTGYLKEDNYVKKRSWWIYAIIIAGLALGALIFHYYKTGFTIESFGNQQKTR